MAPWRRPLRALVELRQVLPSRVADLAVDPTTDHPASRCDPPADDLASRMRTDFGRLAQPRSDP